MNLTQIQYFKHLAETEHYSRVADDLGIATSALSRSISALEKELGVQLFEKSGRNIRLTRYGATFYDYVKDSLNSLELGTQRLMAMTDPSQGELNIGMTFSLGPKVFPEILRRFTSTPGNKGYQIRLFQNSSEELIKWLKDDTCDAVLCSYVPNATEVCFIPILSNPLQVIVPLHHPLASRSFVNMAQLVKYPFVLNTEKAPFLLKLFHQNGFYPNLLSQVQGECAVTGLVSVNYGISIIDSTVDTSGYDVTRIPIPELDNVQFPIHLAYMKNHWLSPAAKSFIKFVTTEIKEISE